MRVVAFESLVMQKDPYATLGVKSTATQAEIQAAYRKKARELHPDVNEAPDAEDRFRDLVDAYDLLRDEEKRARYDAFGRAGPSNGARAGGRRRRRSSRNPFSDLGFEDIRVGDEDLRGPFEDLLRRERSRRRGGTEVRAKKEREVHLGIPLAHAFTGTTLDMSVDIPDDDGEKRTHTLRLKIPQGAKNGDRLKLKDPDVTVVLRLEAPDGVEVDGRDVRTTVDLAPWEAALGGEVEFPSPKGPMRLKVPACTSTGQKLRLRGQGIPQKPGRDGEPGDLYVKVRIVVPSVLTEEEREAFEQLAKTSAFDPRAT
ncbi:MAG: DnaJ C-terminal domain-containing protein [Myxococcota bacterium]